MKYNQLFITVNPSPEEKKPEQASWKLKQASRKLILECGKLKQASWKLKLEFGKLKQVS
jgi:hypothetical protein